MVIIRFHLSWDMIFLMKCIWTYSDSLEWCRYLNEGHTKYAHDISIFRSQIGTCMKISQWKNGMKKVEGRVRVKEIENFCWLNFDISYTLWKDTPNRQKSVHYLPDLPANKKWEQSFLEVQPFRLNNPSMKRRRMLLMIMMRKRWRISRGKNHQCKVVVTIYETSLYWRTIISYLMTISHR